MTLPASGQISMSDVSTELGRASNYASSLGETAVRNLAGVASGAIAFSNLHGKSSFSFTATNQGDSGYGVWNYETESAYAAAGISYYANGTVARWNEGAGANWCSPADAGTGKYIRARKIAGALTPSWLDTWYQMNATRSWSISATSVGWFDCELAIDFSHDGSNVALTRTVWLYVTIDW